jgi:hypothetical protein
MAWRATNDVTVVGAVVGELLPAIRPALRHTGGKL